MKLPEIFKNRFKENVNNNKEVYMGSLEDDDIFKKLPVKVKLITNSGEEVTSTIIGKTKNYLITKNRNVIYINDIKEIKRA